MGTPGSRKRRAGIEKALHTNVIDVSIWQKRPYTMVSVITKFAGEQYNELGFTKVCWPDNWDDAYGISMATAKAIADIAKRIAEEQDA